MAPTPGADLVTRRSERRVDGPSSGACTWWPKRPERL